MSISNEDNYKLAVHDERINNHEKRISKVEDSISGLGKLELILEAQVELNKKQSLQMEQSEKTFNIINENLTRLNYSNERLKEDFDKAKEETDSRINNIKEKVNNKINKSTIDTSDWGVKAFYWVVGLILAIVAAWVMKTSGLK